MKKKKWVYHKLSNFPKTILLLRLCWGIRTERWVSGINALPIISFYLPNSMNISLKICVHSGGYLNIMKAHIPVMNAAEQKT